MQIQVCKSKIYNVRVTGLNLEYEGSLTLSTEFREQANLYPFERILVTNLENGERFETYVIDGGRGGGQRIILNGAAARKALIGDRLIILAFAIMEPGEMAAFKPAVVNAAQR